MSAPLMTVEALRAAGRTPPAHCRIALDDGRQLEVARWLRVLSGKRLTGQATLDGQPVLAKLFIAASNSARHQQRERQGLAALARLAARLGDFPRLLPAVLSHARTAPDQSVATLACIIAP